MKKRRLFECVGDNNFKLIKESDWATTQEHNGNINSQRRMLRAEGQYIKAAGESKFADEEVKGVAKKALEDIAALDSIITKGYLSSGYQYDDDDPRNQMDQHGDRYWDDDIAKARTGSSREEEIEAEIRGEIAKRHLDDHMRYYREFFSRELAEQLFPPTPPEAQGEDFVESEYTGMSLSDYMDEVAYHEAEAANDPGDHDY